MTAKKKRRPSARTRARARKRMQRRRILRRVGISTAVVAVIAGITVLATPGLASWAPELLPKPAVYCAADPASLASADVEGWRTEQLQNAATIMLTASALGFGKEGQVLGVMTAMGESSLRNIDYGDWETRGFTNPDGSRTTSIGLFQQQDWWGSAQERMDPATAATLFYRKLALLPDWPQLPPSQAIHRVQVNIDPDYYSRYQSDATAVVDALTSGCPAV